MIFPIFRFSPLNSNSVVVILVVWKNSSQKSPNKINDLMWQVDKSRSETPKTNALFEMKKCRLEHVVLVLDGKRQCKWRQKKKKQLQSKETYKFRMDCQAHNEPLLPSETEKDSRDRDNRERICSRCIDIIDRLNSHSDSFGLFIQILSINYHALQWTPFMYIYNNFNNSIIISNATTDSKFFQ